MKEEVTAAVQAGIRCWASTFNAGDLQGLLALYSEAAVLVPTTAPDPLSGATALQAYFDAVMARQPRLHVHLHEPLAVREQGDWALCSGRYDFSEGEAARPHLAARFSFCWRREGTGWRILEHHSSFAPAAPAARA